MRNTIAVLANSVAGRGRHGGLLPAVLDVLGGSGVAVQLLEPRTAGEAERLCVGAVADGAAAVVAVGGDGTVHRAIQAVAGTGVPFGVVPVGTGNDIAAAAAVPAAPLDATAAIADALRHGRSRSLDLARIEVADGVVRWFGGVLAAGFDAIVNERANRMRWPRGPRRYDLAIAAELARLRPHDYQLTLDGEAHAVRAVLVAVGNAPSYGGGMVICPGADLTDGLLDVVVGGPMGRATLARLTPHVHRGTHVEHPLVHTYRARMVTIAAPGIVGYADGERIAALPLTATCVPRALRLLNG